MMLKGKDRDSGKDPSGKQKQSTKARRLPSYDKKSASIPAEETRSTAGTLLGDEWCESELRRPGEHKISYMLTAGTARDAKTQAAEY